MACQDDSFGPVAPHTCAGLDFTLLFEQGFFSVAVSVLFIIILTLRLFCLRKANVQAVRDRAGTSKIILSIVYVGLEASILVVSFHPSTPRTRLRLAAPILEILAALGFLLLSQREHTRSIRPSTITCSYLSFSAVLKAAEARTLWLRRGALPISFLYSFLVGLELFLLAFEVRNKKKLLVSAVENYPPEALSGIISKLFFWWLNPLFWAGFKTVLDIEDLFGIDQSFFSRALSECFEEYLQFHPFKWDHSLCLSLIIHNKWSVSSAVLPRLLQTAFTFVQPLLIHRIIDFVGDPSAGKDVGYSLIGATGLIYLGAALSSAYYKHHVYRFITMTRGSLIALVYNKTLKIDVQSCSDTAAITLANTDIDRIAVGLSVAHEVWASPIDLAVALFLLERQISWACVAPVALTLLATVTSVWIAQFVGGRQKLWLEAVQARISVTASVLQKMIGIRMMGMTVPLAEKVQILRKTEVGLAKQYLRLDALANVVSNIPTTFSPVLTFALYTFVTAQGRRGNITSAQVFTTLSLINLMTAPLGLLLSALPSLMCSAASFNRIQKYLLKSDRRDQRQSSFLPGVGSNCERSMDESLVSEAGSRNESMTQPFSLMPLALIKNGSFSYQERGNSVLRDVDFRIMRGELAVITGSVGSGKSTLIKALLGEVRTLSGSTFVNTSSMMYCSRDPWLMNLSIKENILMKMPLGEKRYQEVIDACDLRLDLDSFPQGDLTVVGAQGGNLSGGQRQRVALARALYSEADFLLFDDVLGCLDPKTADLVYEKIFGRFGFLRIHGQTAVLTTHNLSHRKHADNFLLLESGSILKSNTQLLTGQSKICIALGGNKKHDSRMQNVAQEALADGTEPSKNHQLKKIHFTSDQEARQICDSSVYLFYFRSIGWYFLMLFVLLVAVFTFCSRFQQVWLAYWVDASTSKSGRGTNTLYMVVLLAFAVVAIVFFGLAIVFMFQIVVPRSARRLHKRLLKSTMGASYTFFCVLNTGAMLNRFSQDMSLVDIELPSDALETTIYVMSCLAQAGLIFSGVKYIVPAIPAVIGMLFLLQWYYLKTARQLRHLDLESKSPLYSHLLETYEGLLTIRAARLDHFMREKCFSLLDASQKPYYLLFCIQRWLTLVLSLSVGAIAVLLVALAVTVGDKTATGSIGIALLNIVTFNQSLTNLIIKWTSLETSLGAVARVRAFVHTAVQEEDRDNITMTSQIVDKTNLGCIEFKNVSAFYALESKPVLRNLTFTIQPGTRVGICGRTGSGKSSIILSLLRMLPLSGGTICLNGIDISTVPCSDIRDSASVIPQDCVIFPGTARFNLDPGRCYSDAAAIKALQAVGLWDMFSSRNGLETEMSNELFSNGQQQLFCGARTILNKEDRQFLILDEVTSSLDRASETTLLNALSIAFKNKTLLAVAHRLESIVDLDLVLVLDNGQLVEVGRPSELLQRHGSCFKSLWDQQKGS